MRSSLFLFLMLILFGCAPSAPVQTSVATVGDTLVVATFNDTTTLYFHLKADGEAELTWDATDGKSYNTPGRYQHKGRLVVPSQITVADKVCKVTSVADNALFQQRSLSELYLPDGIRHIGNRAVSGCDRLVTLRLPETLETVGDEAFARCKQLTSVHLPDGISHMGRYAMYDCKRLRKVEIPAAMTELPEGFFYGCFSLINVKLNDRMTLIGERAFGNCEQLQEIEIPNSVSEIKGELFSGCISLRSVRLSSNIKDIPFACFSGCRSLAGIKFPSIENIYPEAFVNCGKIKKINLPNGLKRIGYNAFASCSSIEDVQIPPSVEFVGDNVFVNCKNLKDIYLFRTKPIEIESEEAFPGEPCRVNIPKGSLDSYQFTAKWKKFNYREIVFKK